MIDWLPIIIMALIGSFIGRHYGWKLVTRQIEQDEKRRIRDNNAIRMGLIETYQTRSKKYISFENVEELYNIMRNHF